LDTRLALSVIVGLGTGIALIVVLSNMPLPDGYVFRPDGQFDWSPTDKGLPRLFLTEDKTDDELNGNVIELSSSIDLGVNDPDVD
jgi:hypothetical protein